ncbi:hypothetical protein J5Y09_23265 [Roseomonas sp. PWR1]|uniref:Sulfatase N-terminal domain-containing protein n=1 Tax=Roseomonas nitratireducens TaxID=2820810 RepID=A0ABS4AZQ8_9PROT|nr:sulfatase-like hydrolase/transferase [Neoroseomonas nitratireducens]MBP0466868.1 hypothetical protein [Neoroseomonas nitratireducens]
MSATLHLLAGALLPWPGWALLRLGAGARASRWMLLDAAPVLAGFAALLALTARPVLAGGLACGACVFLAVADRAKRAAIGEPLAFTDGGLLWQVAAHPRFYLPFVPKPVLLGGIAAGGAAFLAVLALEPAIPLGAGPRILLLGVAGALVALLLRPFLLLAGAMPARDPAMDAARFGPLATFALHARRAALERPARRVAHPPAPAVARPGALVPHLVLLQLESFCDPRRLGLARGLPCWDALGAEARSRGALAVPGFGANTMRTEFVVLTGMGDAALGLDRLNPYFRFARHPVGSLAWALSGTGHEAICLHPFDPRFFGRDRVLPALGFRRFLAAAEFADAPREAGLVTDAAVGARVAALLAGARGPMFLYAITVAAHGPWPGDDPADAWAGRMAATDAMLGALADAARAAPRPVVLAAFGDHRPALPAARGGTETDYLIWHGDAPGAGARRDLDAAGLHRAVRAAVLDAG